MKMNMRAVSAVAVVTGLALAGCGGSDDDKGSDGASASSGGDGKKVAYLSPVASQPDQQAIAKGIEEGAKSLGWESSVLDSNLSPDRQVANVDTSISRQLDAIGTWTLDPGATAGSYQRANEAGIPVVGVNSDGTGVTATVWQAIYQCEAGGPMEELTAMIAEQEPKAKVVVMGGPPVPSLESMTKCFTEAAKKAGFEIVASVNNTADTSAGAQRLMEDLVTKHPDVQAVWAYNDATALGASAAIDSRGKQIAEKGGPGVIIMGNNSNAEAIEAIKAGKLTTTWNPNPKAVGMAVAKQMQTALEGGDAGKTVPPVTVKATLIAKDNVDAATEPSYTLDDLPLVE
jgi:ribose transport system substrate-binding protein